jgi:hypothetical protein
MRIRMEIDDPQSNFPRIALGTANRSLRPEAICPRILYAAAWESSNWRDCSSRTSDRNSGLAKARNS